MIVALNHALGHRSMDLLLYLRQIEGPQIHFYTADGVLQFAGLIAAGLVSTHAAISGFTQSTVTSYHYVYLSPKGKLLVEAWLAGDEAKYREAMNKTV